MPPWPRPSAPLCSSPNEPFSARYAEGVKSEIRARLRGARRRLSAETLRGRAESLAGVLGAEILPQDRVLGYLPMPGEPDVLPFLALHHERGGEVFVPVIAGERRMDWVRWTPDAPTRRSAFAPVQEPEGEHLPLGLLLEELSIPAAGLTILVPALAVDTAGNRLGQGGGYYDSMFGPYGSAPEAEGRFIGVVHSEEILDPGSFEVRPHDLQTLELVTEKGLKRLYT